MWVKDGVDTKALPLMIELMKYGYEHCDVVILEGIMYDEWYSPLFKTANELYGMPDPYLKGNKAGNRPHYYCFEDTNTGIYWMIPLSSRIDKYKGIVEIKAKAGKPCDIIHIVKLDDSRESAFLIMRQLIGRKENVNI